MSGEIHLLIERGQMKWVMRKHVTREKKPAKRLTQTTRKKLHKRSVAIFSADA